MNFILPGMMAFGRINSEEFPISSDSIDEYLASIRKYEKIEIQPLIIQTEESLAHHWNISPCGGYSMAASNQGIYEIRLQDSSLDASNLADALHGMMAVMQFVPPEELIVIPVEAACIPSSRIISLDDAVEIYKSTLPYTSDVYDYSSVFLNGWCRSDCFDANLWLLIANTIGDEQVIYASHFLRAAFEKYLFLGDDIESVILRHEETPSRIMEAVDVENAIHNAYKIIEAIYGGTLASDWHQVADRLIAKGIDTTELAGYTTHNIFQRESVLEKIKRLKQARDDRAAHGRIHQNRKSTYYELMDYQELVRHLLYKLIRTKYPQTINLEYNKAL